LSNTDEEPAAADAREIGDGPKDAQLKIIAGLLDVGYDELKQRDIHRRARRFALASAVSGIVAIVTATLAVLAMNARNDAERRQAAAEDLISFMIGDLRGELEAVGRLDLLDAIGDQAIEFYGTLESQDLTDAVLATRVRVLRQIGEVWSAQGKLDAALQSFRESLRLSELLAERNPQRADLVFEVGQAHFWVGYVLFSWSRLDEAKRSFTAYDSLATELLQSDPANAEYMLEAAYAQSNLGTIAMAHNELDSANRHFLRAVAINQELHNLAPDDLLLEYELAQSYSWMGAVAGEFGHSEDAIRWYQQELEIRERLAIHADNKDYLRALANAQQLLAFQHHLAGDFQPGWSLAEASLEMADALVIHDQTNTDWQRLRNQALLTLGRIAFVNTQAVEADRFVQAALAGVTALQRSDPSNTVWLNDFALASLFDARIHLYNRLPKQAVHILEIALDKVSAHDDSNVANSLGWVRGALHLAMGDAHDQLGQGKLAKHEWRLAFDLMSEKGRDSNEPLTMATWGLSLARVGRANEALTVADQLAARGYGLVNKLAKITALR